MGKESQLDQVRLQDVFVEEREATNSPYRQAFEASLVVLECVNTHRLAVVHASRKRVNAIMDGVQFVSQPGPNGRGLLHRIPEIHFELNSFLGIAPGTLEIEKCCRTIAALRATFDYLVPTRIEMLPANIREEAGEEKLEAMIRLWIEKVIWDSWIPAGGNALEMATSLKTTVINSLYYFPPFARAYINGERPKHGTFLLSERSPHHGLLDETLDEWHTNVSNLRIWQVFYLIEGLAPRLRRALLDRFGYLYPNMLAEERLAKYNMSRKALREDFIRATREVSRLISATYLTGREFPSGSIASVVKEVQESPIYMMNQRVLHFDSPRIPLLGMRKDSALAEKLSPTERQVLDLATQLEGNRFINSNNLIAEKIGFSPGTVGELLKVITETALNGGRWPVYSNGRLISPSSNHYFLIETRDSLSPEQLAALHPSERRFLDMITTPDEKGRYPGIRETIIKLRVKGNVKKIINALEKSDWVTSLREKVEQALLENRERFSGEEIEIMEYILKIIKEGRPLRSRTCRGIGWDAICRGLGKHRSRGSILNEKLKALS